MIYSLLNCHLGLAPSTEVIPAINADHVGDLNIPTTVVFWVWHITLRHYECR